MEMPESLEWWLSGIVVLQVMILFILLGQAGKLGGFDVHRV